MRRLSKATESIRSWMHRSVRGPHSPRLPVLLNLPVTDNCNARCVMCDVWKTRSTGELTVAELSQILRDPLFFQVRHAGISGGEPSLREDLPQLAQSVITLLPRLQSLSVTSHGFHHQRWRRFLPVLREACVHNGVDLTLNLSLDGVGEVHDRVRGIPGAFEKVVTTSAFARNHGVRVMWHCTISSENAWAAGHLLEHARDSKIEVIFRQATAIARLDNAVSLSHVALDEDQRSFLADFLSSPEVQDATSSPARRLFYRDLAHRLTTNAPRSAPCHFQDEGVLLDAHGNLFQCSISSEAIGNALTQSAHSLYFSDRANEMRRRLRQEVCPGCVHDQSGTWDPLQLAQETVRPVRLVQRAARWGKATSLALEAAPLVARARWQLATRPQPRDASQPRLTSRPGGLTALVVGAYGGEHVGDAAILGGVLGRLQRDHGVTHAIVVSTRPDRTERWVRSIHTAVSTHVVPSSSERIRQAVREVDVVVYGGGPLMDLPTLLVRHLEAVVLGKEHGVPFLMEGIGIGPFKLAPSEQIAALLLGMATGIRVRSKKAGQSPLLAGRVAALAQDPAFDYLASRTELGLATTRERLSLSALFHGSGDKRLVGINIRPFWHKYSDAGATSLEKRQEHFLDEFGAALVRLTERHEGRVGFRFFPMNADRFGFSDLACAYALSRRLPSNVDFKVWDAEPGVDSVLSFLRRVDAVVAMRFHAAIFALSQGKPVVGIDYQFGKRGKVADLLEEAGHGNDLVRAEDFSADALVERLDSTLARAVVQRRQGT